MAQLMVAVKKNECESAKVKERLMAEGLATVVEGETMCSAMRPLAA